MFLILLLRMRNCHCYQTVTMTTMITIAFIKRHLGNEEMWVKEHKLPVISKFWGILYSIVTIVSKHYF